MVKRVVATAAVTQAELAREFGLHVNSVKNWRRNPVWPFGAGPFPVPAVAAWRFLHVRREATPGIVADFAGYAKAMKRAGLGKHVKDVGESKRDAARTAEKSASAEAILLKRAMLLELGNTKTRELFIDRNFSDRLMIGVVTLFLTRMDQWVATLPKELAGMDHGEVFLATRDGWDSVQQRMYETLTVKPPSTNELAAYRAKAKGLST